MKTLKILFVVISLISTKCLFAQDPPAGYTTYYKLRYWSEGDHPGADSVNQNLFDIDLHLKNRDKRIDSLKAAFTWMFNFPSGTWKRYDSNEFDDDTLKVKSGVFPKLSLNNNFTGLNNFKYGEVKFEKPEGTTLNFVFDNDIGGIFFKKNTSTTLLKFDENDGLYWQFMYPMTVEGNIDITGSYKINGVTVPSPPDTTRLAFVDKANTFSQANVFGKNVTMNGTNVLDTIVSSYVNSDIVLVPGQDTWIKTRNANPLYLGANNDTAMKVSTDNGVKFYESITVDADVSAGSITASTISGSISASDIETGTLSNSRLGNEVPLISDTNKFLKRTTIAGPLYFGTPRTTSATSDTLKVSGSSEDFIVSIDASNGGGNHFYFPPASNCPGKFVIVNITDMSTTLQIHAMSGVFRGGGFNDVKLDLTKPDQQIMFYSDGTNWWFNAGSLPL